MAPSKCICGAVCRGPVHRPCKSVKQAKIGSDSILTMMLLGIALGPRNELSALPLLLVEILRRPCEGVPLEVASGIRHQASHSWSGGGFTVQAVCGILLIVTRTRLTATNDPIHLVVCLYQVCCAAAFSLQTCVPA